MEMILTLKRLLRFRLPGRRHPLLRNRSRFGDAPRELTAVIECLARKGFH